MSGLTFPTQRVLELACAAQRRNNGYLKEARHNYAADGRLMYTDLPNRELIVCALTATIDPNGLRIDTQDQELAEDIRKYFRKLIFAAVKNEDDFYTQMHGILLSEDVAVNKLGFLACLPSTYLRDYAKTYYEKKLRDVTPEHLGTVGQELMDLDCEIISQHRSKVYDAYNYDAIIDNKLVSWMGKPKLAVGPCVIISARVKDHAVHWRNPIPVTRLNYVKAFQ